MTEAKYGVLAGEAEIIGERCMDGGTCHHMCQDTCFRKECCSPLGGAGLNDDWSIPKQEYKQMKHTLVNIPDPNNSGSRIVGIRIDENYEAWGEMGLSEPCTWLSKQLELNQKQDEFALYGYATPSGKIYGSRFEAVQNCEQSLVKVYVNKGDWE